MFWVIYLLIARHFFDKIIRGANSLVAAPKQMLGVSRKGFTPKKMLLEGSQV
ncbi:MAG: hypothetical protein HN769_12340 [Anaerolineae bacterium]|nr:hypothetical protein [Anaerolineae bacterium]